MNFHRKIPIAWEDIHLFPLELISRHLREVGTSERRAGGGVWCWLWKACLVNLAAGSKSASGAWMAIRNDSTWSDCATLFLLVTADGISRVGVGNYSWGERSTMKPKVCVFFLFLSCLMLCSGLIFILTIRHVYSNNKPMIDWHVFFFFFGQALGSQGLDIEMPTPEICNFLSKVSLHRQKQYTDLFGMRLRWRHWRRWNFCILCPLLTSALLSCILQHLPDANFASLVDTELGNMVMSLLKKQEVSVRAVSLYSLVSEEHHLCNQNIPLVAPWKHNLRIGLFLYLHHFISLILCFEQDYRRSPHILMFLTAYLQTLFQRKGRAGIVDVLKR